MAETINQPKSAYDNGKVKKVKKPSIPLLKLSLKAPIEILKFGTPIIEAPISAKGINIINRRGSIK